MPLPPTDRCRRLVALLLDVGLCTAGGVGPAPVSWSELAQWQRLTAEPLLPWHARAIRQASAAYVAQLAESADPACPAPWTNAPAPDERQQVAARLGAVLRGWGSGKTD